jgi:hypothetical protein
MASTGCGIVEALLREQARQQPRRRGSVSPGTAIGTGAGRTRLAGAVLALLWLVGCGVDPCAEPSFGLRLFPLPEECPLGGEPGDDDVEVDDDDSVVDDDDVGPDDDDSGEDDDDVGPDDDDSAGDDDDAGDDDVGPDDDDSGEDDDDSADDDDSGGDDDDSGQDCSDYLDTDGDGFGGCNDSECQADPVCDGASNTCCYQGDETTWGNSLCVPQPCDTLSYCCPLPGVDWTWERCLNSVDGYRALFGPTACGED